MSVVRHPSELPVHRGTGWSETEVAGSAVFGVPVPMRGRRFILEPSTVLPPIRVTAPETMLYVAAGSARAEAGGRCYRLGRESMIWLGPAAQVVLTAGPHGAEFILAEAAATAEALQTAATAEPAEPGETAVE